MADRYFDLNTAIAAAEADDADKGDGWLEFDAGPNYDPGRPETTKVVDPDTGEERDEPYEGEDPPAERWRINRVLSGWLVVKYLQAPTVAQSLLLAGQIIETSFDPVQWPQFERFLINSKVPLEALDALILNIVKDQIGLPLDR